MNRLLSPIRVSALTIGILVAVGCGQTGDSAATRTPAVKGNDAETAACTLVEVWGAFDYRDQESRYERLLPLLSSDMRNEWADFQVDPSAVSLQDVEDIHVRASQVDSLPDDSALVTVTADHHRHYLPYQSSTWVDEKLRQQIQVSLILQDGQWLVSGWRVVSEQPLNQNGTPTGGVTPVARITLTPN